MKAFLSHSSKDKGFVKQVADSVGSALCEFDEYSFEFTLNTAAIHRALKRSSLFVFFLSQNSVKSSFIEEELRLALEARSRGLIKSILVFSIDQTSYTALPDWLRDTNVAQAGRSPKHCARRIMMALTEIDAESAKSTSVYIGREEDERDLRSAISKPPGLSPIAIHLVGYHGIGRRTLLRHTLDNLFPKDKGLSIEITLGPLEGMDEIYRQLFGYYRASTVRNMVDETARFSKMTLNEKAQTISDLLLEAHHDGDFIVVIDEGGTLTDEGDYNEHILAILRELEGSPKPVLSFIQTRMRPLRIRDRYRFSFHRSVKALKDEDAQDLLGILLKGEGIYYTSNQLEELADIVDNHPLNVHFAVSYAKSYGLPMLLADTSQVVEWKRKRAEDFLIRIIFSQAETEIIAILSEYRYVAQEMMYTINLGSNLDVAASLRKLEEFCCIERRGAFYHLTPTIRDAVRRDQRFERTQSWKTGIARGFMEHVAEYKNEDHVSVALMDTAVVASLKSGSSAPILSALILPSHLITIARDFYDRRHHKEAIGFCKKAYEYKAQITSGAKVELLRIWGLASARGGDNTKDDFIFVLGELKALTTNSSKQTRYFVLGFDARLRGKLDDAVSSFLEAWEFSPNNQSINREIATVYCKQKLYLEAERYAKAAYSISPTNPYIIDIYLETLLGLVSIGGNVDRRELNKVFDDLKRYGDAPNSSFYLVRRAQTLIRDGAHREAIEMTSRAIERTPSLPTPYFIRAEAELALGNYGGAENNISKLEDLLRDTGLELRDDEARLQELKTSVLVERKRFGDAKNLIESSYFLSDRMKDRLRDDLSAAIIAFREVAERRLVDWASQWQSNAAARGLGRKPLTKSRAKYQDRKEK